MGTTILGRIQSRHCVRPWGEGTRGTLYVLVQNLAAGNLVKDVERPHMGAAKHSHGGQACMRPVARRPAATGRRVLAGLKHPSRRPGVAEERAT